MFEPRTTLTAFWVYSLVLSQTCIPNQGATTEISPTIGIEEKTYVNLTRHRGQINGQSLDAECLRSKQDSHTRESHLPATGQRSVINSKKQSAISLEPILAMSRSMNGMWRMAPRTFRIFVIK
ncbi:hypothetical protein BgiBS90_011982 [Biomphalaria glabrata]|nr:hypothetical protein BgiBS90_011982 [Biomphalaria glabrata]